MEPGDFYAGAFFGVPAFLFLLWVYWDADVAFNDADADGISRGSLAVIGLCAIASIPPIYKWLQEDP